MVSVILKFEASKGTLWGPLLFHIYFLCPLIQTGRKVCYIETSKIVMWVSKLSYQLSTLLKINNHVDKNIEGALAHSAPCISAAAWCKQIFSVKIYNSRLHTLCILASMGINSEIMVLEEEMMRKAMYRQGRAHRECVLQILRHLSVGVWCVFTHIIAVRNH